MVMGLWMVNVVFSLGHRLLNFQSARVTYFVNASLLSIWRIIPNAFLWRVYYAAYLPSNPDRVLVRADICYGYCVNSV